MTYTVPQVRVFQDFNELPNVVVQNLNAFVFGPQYKLFRFSNEAEKAFTGLGSYAKSKVTAAYPGLPAKSTADTTYAKLYLENVLLKYATSSDLKVTSTTERNRLRSNNLVLKTENGATRSPQLLKDVEIGDKVKWTATPAGSTSPVTGSSKVVGFVAEQTAPVVGAAVGGTSNVKATNGDAVTGFTVEYGTGNTNKAAAFTAAKVVSVNGSGKLIPERTRSVVTEGFTVTVITGGASGTARVRVKAIVGNYYNANAPVLVGPSGTDVIPLSNGVALSLKRNSVSHVVGDVYTVPAKAASVVAPILPTVQGVYTGTTPTMYDIKVVRGGSFTTAVEYSGVVGTPMVDANIDVSVAGWANPGMDAEYLVECIEGSTNIGTTDPKFRLTSPQGDNVAEFTLPKDTSTAPVGQFGLQLGLVVPPASGSVTTGFAQVIRVVSAKPVVQISDSAGSDVTIGAVTVQGGVAHALGANGLTYKFAGSTGLFTGDHYQVHATPAKAGAVQTVLLADELPTTVLPTDTVTMDLFIVERMVKVPKENRNPAVAPGLFNWTAGTDKVSVEAGLKLQSSRWVDATGTQPYLVVESADMYVEYRALLTNYSGTIYPITHITDVVSTLGPVVEDNPLALAVYAALENSADTTVYYSAVPTNDAAGYAKVLRYAGLTDKVYSFCPVTTDQKIHALVEAHVNEYSTPEKKLWRMAFVGTELPASNPLVHAGTNPSKEDWKATVSKDIRETGTAYTRVSVLGDANLVDILKVGDEVRIKYGVDFWGKPTYEVNTVSEVESDSVFYVKKPLLSEITVGTKIEIYHPLTVPEIATQVAAISRNYGNRRMAHVFPGNAGRHDGSYVGSEFVAAAVAGLVSSVPPQQGLTNIELNGFTDLPLVYAMFSDDELNTMAESGTLIIMQESLGSSVYVRHQLTTAAAARNLNTSEISITKNVDSISYYFSGILKPFIGRYNITPELLAVIGTHVEGGISFLSSSANAAGLLGPQLLNETTLVSLEEHPVLKDQIVGRVDLHVPYMLNGIDLHLVV